MAFETCFDFCLIEEEEEVVVVFMTIAFVRTLEEEDVDDKNDLILVVAVKW
jgi:hypothetical protein